MIREQHYDSILVGAGLASLALSILLARAGKKVLVLEKKKFPAHKVCGEYVSNESKLFLKDLGLDVDVQNWPQIHQLLLCGPKGDLLKENLQQGGFGVSRYTLDQKLLELAQQAGVVVLQETACTGYQKYNAVFEVSSGKQKWTCDVLVAGFGRSVCGNFFKPARPSENWVGIKYHLKTDAPPDQIALYLFPDGYAGASQIEEGKYCFCYLVRARRLQTYRGRIDQLEEEVLKSNPLLAKFLSQSTKLWQEPLTVSNVTFTAKKAVHDGIFYIGDSAGSIAPLTGNGMSNAFRSAAILAPILIKLFNHTMTTKDAETAYIKSWNQQMGSRIRTGRWMQQLFCTPPLTGIFFTMAKQSARLRQAIIQKTHGKVFRVES